MDGVYAYNKAGQLIGQMNNDGTIYVYKYEDDGTIEKYIYHIMYSLPEDRFECFKAMCDILNRIVLGEIYLENEKDRLKMNICKLC